MAAARRQATDAGTTTVNPRARTHDEGLARTASWPRRTAAGPAPLRAAPATFFAHVLPGQAAAPSSPPSGTSGDSDHGQSGSGARLPRSLPHRAQARARSTPVPREPDERQPL